MLIDRESFYTQFDLFTEHLGQDFLAGCIISEKGARNIKITRNCDVQLAANENLYFVPQPCKSYSTASKITSIRTVFLDVDVIDENRPSPEIFPNLILHRSDLKAYQAFWLLENEISVDRFREVQLKLARKFYGDQSVNNANRLMRVAGFRRGTKKKDEKYGIESSLCYKNLHEITKTKISQQSMEQLLAIEFDTTREEPLQKEAIVKIKSNENWEDLERDFSVEEGVFYSYFYKKSKGQGTTKQLFKFACYLVDKGATLEQFEQYCSKNNLENYEISSCDTQEWEKINRDSQKYAKSQQKKETCQEIQNEINQKTIEASHITQEELFEKFPFLNQVLHEVKKYFFVEDEDRFYRHESNNKLTPITKSIFSATFSKYFMTVNKKGKYTAKNPVDVVLSRDHRSHFNVVSSMIYRPHAEILHNNQLNCWHYPVLSASKGGDIDVFLDHVKFLFSGQLTVDNHEVGELFLDFLANAYCSDSAPSFAYMLYAEKFGIGRSFFTKVLNKLMGDNLSTPTDRVVKEHYTGWHSTKQLAIVEELGEDRTFFEQLKPIIGNGRVSHRQMGKDSKTVDNHCSIIMLTNKIRALNIAKGDRRIAVVHMYQDQKSPQYYTQLYDWADNDENIAALAEFFNQRFQNLDKKSMKGHAPLTEAKLLVQKIVTDTETQNIEEALAEISFGENDEFICQRTLIERLYPNITDAVVRYRGSVSKKLQDLNYSALIVGKRLRFGEETKAVTVYVKTSFATKHNKDKSFTKIIELYREFLKNGRKDTFIELKNDVTSHQSPIATNHDTTIVVNTELNKNLDQINREIFEKTKLFAAIEEMKADVLKRLSIFNNPNWADDFNFTENEPDYFVASTHKNEDDAIQSAYIEANVTEKLAEIKPKKARQKKEPVEKVHPNVALARENYQKEIETGKKFKPSATCTDLLLAREQHKNFENDIGKLLEDA